MQTPTWHRCNSLAIFIKIHFQCCLSSSHFVSFWSFRSVLRKLGLEWLQTNDLYLLPLSRNVSKRVERCLSLRYAFCFLLGRMSINRCQNSRYWILSTIPYAIRELHKQTVVTTDYRIHANDESKRVRKSEAKIWRRWHPRIL